LNRVALVGENSTEYVDVLLDIWNRGDCAVLLDWRIPAQAKVSMMQEANICECYIEKDKLDESLIAISHRISFFTFEKKHNSVECLPASVYQKFKSNYSLSEALILYSSGTTGRSKGVILSHYAINTNADAIAKYMNLGCEDSVLIIKSLAHVSTLVGELLVGLKKRVRVFIAPSLTSPQFALKCIEQHRITTVCLNPALLNLYTKAQSIKKYCVQSLKAIYTRHCFKNC